MPWKLITHIVFSSLRDEFWLLRVQRLRSCVCEWCCAGSLNQFTRWLLVWRSTAQAWNRFLYTANGARLRVSRKAGERRRVVTVISSGNHRVGDKAGRTLVAEDTLCVPLPWECVPACHRENGDTRGRSNLLVRGEIRRSRKGELRRRQPSRLPPSFKGDSVGSKDDQIPL